MKWEELLLLSILKYRQFCFRVDKTVRRVREYLPTSRNNESLKQHRKNKLEILLVISSLVSIISLNSLSISSWSRGSVLFQMGWGSPSLCPFSLFSLYLSFALAYKEKTDLIIPSERSVEAFFQYH